VITRQQTAFQHGGLTHVGHGFIYRVVSVAALGGLLFGFDTAVINGALFFLRKNFRWTDFETEIAASSLLVGCILGSSIAGHLSDRYGRRSILRMSAAIFAISSIATALPENLLQFSVARLVAGTAIGIASMLAPLYIAEISPQSMRGRLVSTNQLTIVAGILIAYLTSWGLSFLGTSSWRWMFASAAIPSLLFFFALFSVPESPRWLVKSGRDERAKQVLTSLCEPESRYSEIKATLTEEAQISIFDRSLRRPLLIGITLAILQQVTGINTILYYGSVIFMEQVGSRSVSSALWSNVAIGLVNLLFTIVAVLLIDKVGRKPLLLLGSAGMGCSLLVLCWLFSGQGRGSPLFLLAILAYVACFAISLGPVVWVVITELFPTQVRGRAISVATVSLWLACLLITSSFLSLISAVSIQGTFALYAVLTGFTFVFVLRMVPETKGQSLEEIERYWLRDR
jgi:sugar porter (SP) family MFS transporter